MTSITAETLLSHIEKNDLPLENNGIAASWLEKDVVRCRLYGEGSGNIIERLKEQCGLPIDRPTGSFNSASLKNEQPATPAPHSSLDPRTFT